MIAKQAAERKRRVELTHIWMAAALDRQKRLPALERFVESRQVAQSRQEQRRALQQISARFGIPLKKTRLIRVN